MNMAALIIGIFIIKGIFLWILYSGAGWKVFATGLAGSFAWYPLMMVLYHETAINFWWVLILVILSDTIIYRILLKKSLIKCFISSIFLNVLAMIFFLILNG